MAANTHSLDLEVTSSQCAYITDAAQTGLDITGDISIEAWVNLFNLYNSSGTYRLIISYSHNGTTETQGYLDWTPSTGTWYHIAATVDVSAQGFHIYINGVDQTLTGQSGTGTEIIDSTAEVIVGAYGVHTTPVGEFDGKIDEVRVWNDIRTNSEISTNMQSDVTGQAGLVAYWKFNNSALDETANNNDLTLIGSPVYSTTVPFASYVGKGNFLMFF